MSLVNGDVTIRAGSQDYITWQLLQEDGVSPVDLSTANEVALRLKNKKDKTTKSFSTIDVPQKFLLEDAENGKIQLRPAADDFPLAAQYDFYVDVIDSIGSHPIPEDQNYKLKVIDKIS
jgi:hypothetical protein